MSDNKIISLSDMKKRLNQPTNLSELDYRTEKLLEILDEQQKRIEKLEANLHSVVRILKNLNGQP